MEEINKIKVCHFTSVHKFNDIRIFLKECSSLAKFGFDVYFIGVNFPEVEINSVKISGIDSKNKGRIYRMFITSYLLYKKVLEIDADVYHFHDPELLPFAYLLKRKKKVVVYDVHEDVPRQILGKYWIRKSFRKFISNFFKRFEEYITQKLDVVITATPFINSRFEIINKSSFNINNYPLVEEISPELVWSEKKNEICYTGVISEVRGIFSIIEGLKYCPNVKLNLAGNYSPFSLKNKIVSHSAFTNIQEYGLIEREKVFEIMARSKAGIVIFHPLPNHVDAQPNKIFEYMGAGIPVIASDFKLWKEIIEGFNCGICINPLEPQKVAEAINYIFQDEERAKIMGQNGRKAVLERFNWHFEEVKLLNIYKNIISAKLLK
jgi:glycosyltransferase involved in cell wall biosynthesis